MIKKFFNTQISLWLAAIILLTVGAGLAIYWFYFQEKAYQYAFDLPDFEKETLSYGIQPALSNVDFFNEVRGKLLKDQASFIEINLSSMKLMLFEKGKKIQEFPVLAKGRPGSWWETPAGVYRIETKIKNHFSSFGNVYQPWSLVFQGNFFIHGWPHYEDGAPVDSAYSGGCIRLADKDAKRVFDFAKIGTPVLVFEENFLADGFVYQLKTPEISSQAFLAADLGNNFVFWERNSDKILPVASITKLITALVATEYINLERQIRIDQQMLISTSKPRLKPGQTVRIYDLLYPLLLESSNEAAETLGYYLGQERFVGLMNAKTKAIGMVSASFIDPSGRSAENVASTEDLFHLAKYIYFNRSFIFKISAGQLKETVYGRSVFTNLANFNFFENQPGFVGGKSGQIKAANETMLAVFELGRGTSIRPIAIIVLNSLDSKKDIEQIWQWIQEYY